MSSACDHCARPVKADDEGITCMAFCERMVHYRCTDKKLNKSFIKIVHENQNLMWMCDECAKLMKMVRFKSAVSSFSDVVNTITEKQESAHEEIRMELTKHGQQIAQLTKRIAASSPVLQQQSGSTRQPPSKRRRQEDIGSHKPLLGGTKIVPDASVITVPEPIQLFWVYLSRIHPSAKLEAVEKLVKDCLKCEEAVRVIPLVKRGIDTSRLSFVSYKIGIDPKFREAALDTQTWPKGILFREFEDNSSKNMFLPLLNTPTITISPEAGSSQFTTPLSGINLEG